MLGVWSGRRPDELLAALHLEGSPAEACEIRLGTAPTLFDRVGASSRLHDTLRRARDVAGGKDIRISGVADLVRQFSNAGLVDELVLSLAPTFLGCGPRLFDGIDVDAVTLEIADVVSSRNVTHLRYAVKKR